MGKSLSQIFKEAEAIIEKRANAEAHDNFTSTSDLDDDNIFKLAEAIRNSGTAQSVRNEAEFCFTEAEKLAHSMAILEAVLSSEEFNKMAKFEELAKEKGYSQDKIESALEKISSAIPKSGRRIVDFMEGTGQSLQNVFDSISLGNGSAASKAGRAAGILAPAAAVVGAGAYAGSKTKERQIKNQLGIP